MSDVKSGLRPFAELERSRLEAKVSIRALSFQSGIAESLYHRAKADPKNDMTVSTLTAWNRALDAIIAARAAGTYEVGVKIDMTGAIA